MTTLEDLKVGDRVRYGNSVAEIISETKAYWTIQIGKNGRPIIISKKTLMEKGAKRERYCIYSPSKLKILTQDFLDEYQLRQYMGLLKVAISELHGISVSRLNFQQITEMKIHVEKALEIARRKEEK